VLSAEEVAAAQVFLVVDLTTRETGSEHVLADAAWTGPAAIGRLARERYDDRNDQADEDQPADTHHPPPTATHVSTHLVLPLFQV
jgi:hypothetical protein